MLFYRRFGAQRDRDFVVGDDVDDDDAKRGWIRALCFVFLLLLCVMCFVSSGWFGLRCRRRRRRYIVVCRCRYPSPRKGGSHFDDSHSQWPAIILRCCF